MINFLELAKSRYTTKLYRNEKISAEKISDLQEILRLAPSSINSQPWKFVFVSDEKIKQKLAEKSFFNEAKIKDASHLVVFLGFDDLSKFEAQIRRELPEGAVNYYLQNLKPQGEEAVKTWLDKQVYISLGYFLSACASMEIDSTPMEGIQCQAYDEILQMEGYKTLFAVAIGYRNNEDTNQPSVKPKSRVALNEVVSVI